MSQSTPVKQDRLERHLMRQRGAGARTIAVNFGFSFAVVAPASKPLDDADPPPAKRRKMTDTNTEDLQDHTKVRNQAAQEEASLQIVDNDAPKVKKKPRKGLPVNIVEEVPGNIQLAAGDDSFITRARTKAGGTIHTKSRIGKAVASISNSVSNTAVASEKRGRPRRRAAADTMQRIAEGFAEEALPIDKKRRQAEPPRRCGHKAKPGAHVDALRIVTDGSDVTQESVEPHSEKRAVSKMADVSVGELPQSRSGTKRMSRKKAPAKTTIYEDRGEVKAARVQVRNCRHTSRKRRFSSTSLPVTLDQSVPEYTSDPKRSQIATFLESQQQDDSSDDAILEVKSTPMNLEPKKSLKRRANDSRQALAESSVNMMRTSVSPEKHSKSKRLHVLPPTKTPSAQPTEQRPPTRTKGSRSHLASDDPKTAGEMRDSAATKIAAEQIEPALIPTLTCLPILTLSPSRKLADASVKVAPPDEAEKGYKMSRRTRVPAALEAAAKRRSDTRVEKAQGGSSDVTVAMDSAAGVALSAKDDVGLVSRQDDSTAKSSALSLLSSKPIKTSEKSRKKNTAADVGGKTKTCEVLYQDRKQDEEEDIEWLFSASQRPLSAKSKPIGVFFKSRRHSTKRRKRRGSADCADVDLDDLVENIATLAGKEPR